jgi:hypothetical protein
MMQIGETKNRLTLLEHKHNGKGLFVCSCGNTKVINIHNVEREAIKSCGCYFKEQPSHTIHGGKGTRLYGIWKGMRERCNTPSSTTYKNYGARGIKVCKQWDDFQVFKKWALSHGYNDKLTIDRIDVNGNYEPNNCRWVSYRENSNNKRNSRFIEYQGQIKTVAEWAQIYNLKYGTLWMRLKKGWSVERALTS